MPAITDLWLSGGEPTATRLSDVIDLFVTNNGVDRIIIPTNGLIKARIYDVVDRASETIPIDLYLNIALMVTVKLTIAFVAFQAIGKRRSTVLSRSIR